ncbi:MarR family transcriptional regulator [Chthonobacter albigriseus]|uniref:MarR family transcriptional regulator n=1 Tax=Chthonobacter albigriseus TaxID=1683161 RepID=UPI0015EEB203|nr:helix-turn-helix domain-containing protein [Chthonobacter albigriseus]
MTDELLDFVRASFRSVWSLEVLLFLYRSGDRRWAPGELVAELRSSAQVISDSIRSLVVAGLVDVGPQDEVRYSAASPELHDLVIQVDDVYRRMPSAVRRAIIQTGSDRLRIFADAFRMRKPPQ